MNPGKFSQMMKYLTRAKKEKPDLPDVFPASKAPIPPKTQNVEEIEAINRFNRDNPRTEKAGGGMLVQPSADGSRPGYAYDTSMFKLKDIKKYRAEGKTAKEIADIYDVSLSKYESFVAENKDKLPKVSAKKINFTEDVKQRIKNYDKWAKKNDKPLYKNLGDDSIASETRKRIRDNPNAIWNFKSGKDFIKFPLKKVTEEMLDLPVRVESKFFPAGNIGTNQYGEQLTLRKIFEIASRTDSGAALVDEFYENPTEELFKKLKQKKSDNLTSERIKNLPPKARQRIRERNLISERKWRNSEKGKAYYRKLMAEKGIFSAVTPEEKIWRNIYRAARQKRNEIPRFEIRYPKNIKINPTTGLPEPILSKKGNQYIPWHKIYKDISFLDKETGQIIKFDGVKDWMKNNVEDGVKKYDKAIENYKLQTNISNIEIDGQSLGDIYKKDRIKKGATATEVRLASPATVNHKSGLNNFWDLEVTTSTANQELNNKIQSKITAYKNAKTNLEKNNIFKQMKIDASKIVGGGTLEIDGQIIGKDPTLKTIASALQKELKIPGVDKKLIATLSKDPRCSRGFKSQGGRAGFQEGTPPSLDVCYQGGIKNINSGMKNVTPAQAKNFAAFANRAASFGRGVMKYGIVPEALYVAADSVIRMGMGDTLNESFLRASNYLTPFDGIKKAEMLEADRFFGPEIAGIIGKSIDYKNTLSEIDSLKSQKDNLENLSGDGAFDYIGDTSQDSLNLDKLIKQKEDALNTKFKMTEPELIYAERMQDEVDDARSSGSFFTKLKSKFRDVEPDSDIETLGVPEKTQEDLNKRMLPQAPTIYKVEGNKLIEKNLSEATQTEIMDHVQLLKPYGFNVSTKNLLEQRNYLRGMPISDQILTFGPEATLGFSGTMGEPLNKPPMEKKQNVIGDMEKEIVGQTNVANPFDLDISDIGSGLRGFAAAEGGVASGPPPVRGPNPQGLLSLKNRVRNY